MNKLSRLLELIFVILVFMSCGDTPPPSQTKTPIIQATPVKIPLYVPPIITPVIPLPSNIKLSSDFPDAYKNLLAPGTLTIKNTGTQEIYDIQIKIKPPFGFTGTNISYAEFPNNQGFYPGLSGTCPQNNTLMAGGECQVDLSVKTEGRDVNKILKQQLVVSYKVFGEKYKEKIQVRIKVNDRKELRAKNVLIKKGEISKNLTLKNLSTEDKISNIKIEAANPALKSVFKFSDPVQNFCLKDPHVLKEVIDLEASNQCMISFTYEPKVAYSNIQEIFNITYKINGKDQITQFSIEMQENAPADTLRILNNNFKKIQIVSGNQKTIKLRIINPAIGKKATQLKLEPLMPLIWDNQLELDNNSSCIREDSLDQGQECNYNILMRPTALDQNYQKQLVFKYKNHEDKDIEIPITLQGSIEVFPPGTIIKLMRDSELFIQAQPTLNDEYWPYIKRPLKSDLIKNMSTDYSDEVLARIPDDTWNYSRHMPWSFTNAWHTSDSLVKLKDIVPDRITDPETGEKYIKLYHGSSLGAKDAFIKGSSGIDFGIANTIAFGQGFYLSADINESKRYACQAMVSAAVKKGLLVIVGVKEDADVQGKRGENFIWNGLFKDTIYSNEKGESKDKNVLFRTGQHNQFVFFKEAQPHMKIFKVIELPANFGASSSIVEDDGFATNDTTVDTNPDRYQCDVK